MFVMSVGSNGRLLGLSKDYYKILGVSKEASVDEMKSSFRSLSKKHHPDVGGDEEKFKEINEAYSVLSDPQKKQEYDNPGFWICTFTLKKKFTFLKIIL